MAYFGLLDYLQKLLEIAGPNQLIEIFGVKLLIGCVMLLAEA